MSARPSPRGEHRTSPLRAALPGVVTLALVVRLLGLTWGLPDATHYFSFHPDEFDIAGRALRILNTGSWDPEFFNYGSLPIYLTAIVSWPFHAAGFVQTVTGTHVVARLLSIVAGAATALVAARIAARFVPAPYAVFAALAVACAPGHALHSGFATPDAITTCLVAVALLLAIRALEGAPRAFALAGAVAGFAAGTKYAAGLVLVAPLLAALLAPGGVRRRLARVAAAAGAALAAFLAAVPYALLTPARFLADVRYELLVHPREGHLDIFTRTGDGWSHHLLANLPYVLGPPLLVLALAGVVVMAMRRRPAGVVLLAFALPYFAGLGLSQVRFLRYTLPLVPVLAVAAAVALDAYRGTSLARRIRPAIAGAAAVGYAAALTLLQVSALLAPDPRTRAARWIAANAPPGSTVGLASIPWFHTAAVTPWNGGERSLPRFNATPAAWRFVVCGEWDTATLRAERPYLFLMSEFEWREAERLRTPQALAFLAALDRAYLPAARFEGIAPGPRRLFGRGFAPHDWLYPFAEVRVWRRRD